MTREERLELLKQIEKDIYVCSLESTLLEDAKSCAIHSAIEELEQKPRWIPVSERLPKDGEYVLVWYEYFRYGEYNCMYQTYGIGYQYDGCWGGSVCGINSRCIAWMPLPKPYEPKENEVSK